MFLIETSVGTLETCQQSQTEVECKLYLLQVALL